MIIVNQSKFDQFNENDGRALENTYMFIVSRKLTSPQVEGSEEAANNNDVVMSLCPSQELLAQLESGEIGKKKFKKAYKKELKSHESRFFIYTIVRSIKEKHIIPIFVCSDDEWDLGYLKVFAGILNDQFGLETLKIKDYLKAVKGLWKEVKNETKKEGKRRKLFREKLEDYAKDNAAISFDGLKNYEKLEQEFAVDRVALLIGQSDDPTAEIKTKEALKALAMYEQHSKKAAKRVKKAINELNLSKKRDRWGRKDAINVILQVYNLIHAPGDQATA